MQRDNNLGANASQQEIDVFISYSRADIETAKAVQCLLEKHGLKVWRDEQETSQFAGQDFPQRIEDALRRAKKVLVLWSAASVGSTWVQAEALKALELQKLLPLMLEDCNLPVPYNAIHALKVTHLETDLAVILTALGAEPLPGPAAGLFTLPGARTFTARLPATYATRLYGRDAEMADLFRAWDGAPGRPKTHILALDAIGGAGKTALIHHFVTGMQQSGWRGARNVYIWSFYSQGTDEKRQGSADEFFADALSWFGYRGEPITSPWQRGRKLASLIKQTRTLLVLDGLEPLQYPASSKALPGKLRDPALETLVKELARDNPGLLVITTRLAIPELRGFGDAVIREPLTRIAAEPAAELLEALGVAGRYEERMVLAEDYDGHALALTLGGRYLAKVHGGDIRCKDEIPPLSAVSPTLGGDRQAARVMRRYEVMFEEAATGDALAARQLAILHILGLFDRKAEAAALKVLREPPVIPGLTDSLVRLNPADWAEAVEALREAGLVSPPSKHDDGGLDCHPLVREYFGPALEKDKPEAWRLAHSRLYDHYRYDGLPEAFHTPEAYGVLALVAAFPQLQDSMANVIAQRKWPEDWIDALPTSLLNGDWSKLGEAAVRVGTVEFNEALAKFLPGDIDGMQLCFSAIAHGCAADRHQEAYSEVYFPRVMRGMNGFIVHKLGALNNNLTAVAAFFDEHWNVPSRGLREDTKARVLNYAAFALKALGHLREAAGPLEASLNACTIAHDWENAAIDAGNVSVLCLTLGDISGAIAAARISVLHADNSSSAFMRRGNRTLLAGALHHAGEAHEAQTLFTEAEAMQAKHEAECPRLTSPSRYGYYEFLLSQGQAVVVIEHAKYALQVSMAGRWHSLLAIALDTLSLGRAHAALAQTTPQSASESGESARLAQNHLDTAVGGLLRAGRYDYLPRGLLARAAFLRIQGDFRTASYDLSQAQEIASRSEMRLHLTDVHLESARLALAEIATSGAAFHHIATASCHKAAALITATGYKRRKPELEAIRACLAGVLPASLLGPDREKDGRPIWHDLAAPASGAAP